MTSSTGIASPVWAPPPGGDGRHNDDWVALGRALADQGIEQVRTTTVRAGRWAEQMQAERDAFVVADVPWGAGNPVPLPRVANAICAVRAGVAVQDMYAASRSARLEVGGSGQPALTSAAMSSVAGISLSFLSMRALIGWLSAETHIIGPGYQFGHVHNWAFAGLGEDGWLYAAAGFTLAETLDMKDAGVLDPAAAAMMAGLRGVPLPVG